ncbi:hypothetical protein MCOR25_006568 [Pyricularia grisea]|uniref:NmrA-like domain-containing protein n=1 Tax=Pyricularia grisea TaxID=148305 RepID=A0A6P8BKN8_PYRGI|nr:uncharacterized protein PgNI_01282 [Pyricularia grisea]KAI6361103.1 hypothetical protein MCOR25_006568 [Pyricularia grisea]TLD17152.1 hypothetical protein PgNI_01282 [Pyricularia grisea]
MKTVGIFPASGGLGGSTIAHLRKIFPGDHLILISRHPENQPAEYSQGGVRLRQAFYESSPQELEKSFKDVEVLFLISYPSHVRDYRVQVQIPAVDAAVRAGVSHIFYSSLAFAGPVSSSLSKAEVMQAHLVTESHLKFLAANNPKFTFTSIREGLYSESYPIYTAFFDAANPSSEIRIPHDGKGPGVAWAKRDELGEATARLIAHYSGAHVAGLESIEMANRILLLTGPKVWTLEETVEQLSKCVGKPVAIREVSVDEYVSQLQVTAVFGSQEKATTWATAWEAIKAGETAVVTPLLEQVLGRKPEDFEITLKNHLGASHK